MAEGLLRHLAGNDIEALSGGTRPWEVHPFAIKAMAESGMDISGHVAKHVSLFAAASLDYVITLCDGAREECPLFARAARRLHWPVHDPSNDGASPGEKLEAFRKARDEIRDRIVAWLAENPFE
jgi:arsenate reductase